MSLNKIKKSHSIIEGSEKIMLKKMQYPWFFIGGGIIFLSILFTMCSKNKQNTLDVYDGDVISTQEITTENLNIETITYENSKAGFHMDVPADWTKVVKDGCDTYIHAASSSSIQIQILPYDSAINNVNQELLSSSIVQDGFTFVNYNRIDTSSYEIMYQKNEIYDYIEEVKWSRDYIVKMICIFNDENYSKIYPYYDRIINSFAWDTDNIIPTNLFLYYSEYGDFEFSVPYGWTFGNTNTSFVAINNDNTAQITITVSERTDLLTNLTATDITNYLNNNKNSFMLKDFSTSATSATATAYYNNGTASTNKTYLFANGQYLYSLQFDFFNGSIDDSVPDLCASYFREFVTQKIIDESQIATPTDLQ